MQLSWAVPCPVVESAPRTRSAGAGPPHPEGRGRDLAAGRAPGRGWELGVGASGSCSLPSRLPPLSGPVHGQWLWLVLLRFLSARCGGVAMGEWRCPSGFSPEGKQRDPQACVEFALGVRCGQTCPPPGFPLINQRLLSLKRTQGCPAAPSSEEKLRLKEAAWLAASCALVVSVSVLFSGVSSSPFFPPSCFQVRSSLPPPSALRPDTWSPVLRAALT